MCCFGDPAFDVLRSKWSSAGRSMWHPAFTFFIFETAPVDTLYFLQFGFFSQPCAFYGYTVRTNTQLREAYRNSGIFGFIYAFNFGSVCERFLIFSILLKVYFWGFVIFIIIIIVSQNSLWLGQLRVSLRVPKTLWHRSPPTLTRSTLLIMVIRF